MAVLRDRPYVQFNFLVDLGDGQHRRAGGRLPGSQRHRHGSHRRRVPQRQRAGEQRPQDHRPEQVDRRHAEARRDRLAQPLPVARPDPQRRPERAAQRSRSSCRTRTTPRSCRPGSCCARASSSTPAARSTPRAPTWRWKSWSSPTSGSRWSSDGGPLRSAACPASASRPQPPPPGRSPAAHGHRGLRRLRRDGSGARAGGGRRALREFADDLRRRRAARLGSAARRDGLRASSRRPCAPSSATAARGAGSCA